MPENSSIDEVRTTAERLSKTITQLTLLRVGVFFVFTLSFCQAFGKLAASKPAIDALTTKMDAGSERLQKYIVFVPPEPFGSPLDPASRHECEAQRLAGSNEIPDELKADVQSWQDNCTQLREIYRSAFRLPVTVLGTGAEFDLRSWIYSIPFLLLLSEVYLSLLRNKRRLLLCAIAPRLLQEEGGKVPLLASVYVSNRSGFETAFARFSTGFIRLFDVASCASLLGYLFYAAQPILDVWTYEAMWDALGLFIVAVFYLAAYREHVARSLDAQVESLLAIELPRSIMWRFWQRSCNLFRRLRGHALPRIYLSAGSVLVLLTLLLPISMVSCNGLQIKYGNGYELIRGKAFWPSAFYLEHLGPAVSSEDEHPLIDEVTAARESGKLLYTVAIGLALLTSLLMFRGRKRLATGTATTLSRLLLVLSLSALMFTVADAAFSLFYMLQNEASLYWVSVAYWLLGTVIVLCTTLLRREADEQKWRELASATCILYVPVIICSLVEFAMAVHDSWKNGLSILTYVLGVTCLCVGYDQVCHGDAARKPGAQSLSSHEPNRNTLAL